VWYNLIKIKKERGTKKMTLYEKNYKARLDEMLTTIIHKFGFEHERTINFARYVEKYYNNPNYDNRETMERIFKSYTK
jgi:hypothetical protein